MEILGVIVLLIEWAVIGIIVLALVLSAFVVWGGLRIWRRRRQRGVDARRGGL